MNSVTLDREPTVVDLFCGAGGLSLGFERAGFSLAAGVDTDDRALETWHRNHDGETHTADLSERSPAALFEALAVEMGDVDVVVGGPPCKDFTKANQKVDLGRNNLVTLFAEYVDAVQPTAFLIENVRQLTSTHDDILNAVYDSLDDDYTIVSRLLDAADYGVPQHRIRAFVLGIKPDGSPEHPPRFPAPTHGPDSQSPRTLRTAGEALADTAAPDDPAAYAVTSQHADLLPAIPPGMNYSFYTNRLGYPEPKFEWRSRFSDYLYKADPAKPVRTLKAQPGAASGPFHWDNRKFTAAELRRLQSFPDAFVFPHGHTEIVRQIGNSVPPAQSYALARAIRRQIPTSDTLLSPDDSLEFRSRRRTSTDEYQQKANARLAELGLLDDHN